MNIIKRTKYNIFLSPIRWFYDIEDLQMRNSSICYEKVFVMRSYNHCRIYHLIKFDTYPYKLHAETGTIQNFCLFWLYILFFRVKFDLHI